METPLPAHMSIPSNLRAQRARCRLTLKATSERARELASDYGVSATGLSAASIGEYERETTAPNAEVIRILAKVYGVSVIDLAPDLPDLQDIDPRES